MAGMPRKFETRTRWGAAPPLNRMKQSGAVQELHEGRVTRFDANIDRHHHFVCKICGRIEDVASKSLPELKEPLLKDVQIASYSVALRGVCPVCKRTEKE